MVQGTYVVGCCMSILLLFSVLVLTGLFCVQEIEVGGSRKAIIIFVPVPQLKSFQKIQVRLVRELEKKFSGKHVVFIAQVRRMVGSPDWCWIRQK